MPLASQRDSGHTVHVSVVVLQTSGTAKSSAVKFAAVKVLRLNWWKRYLRAPTQLGETKTAFHHFCSVGMLISSS